uniref:Uncharacterized protein n=2 Tax=Amorphochlora amoebiformis TaxID=1561963 RepID=A0A7S0H5M0_9EUKA|mmetsp:Transcript_5721/g.8779  ORF Transcript_5721/g.8779 Transcript_5721/m.8779 type:complete len:190 (+) Transcript_5721:69-638(+)
MDPTGCSTKVITRMQCKQGEDGKMRCDQQVEELRKCTNRPLEKRNANGSWESCEGSTHEEEGDHAMGPPNITELFPNIMRNGQVDLGSIFDKSMPGILNDFLGGNDHIDRFFLPSDSLPRNTNPQQPFGFPHRRAGGSGREVDELERVFEQMRERRSHGSHGRGRGQGSREKDEGVRLPKIDWSDVTEI